MPVFSGWWVCSGVGTLFEYYCQCPMSNVGNWAVWNHRRPLPLSTVALDRQPIYCLLSTVCTRFNVSHQSTVTVHCHCHTATVKPTTVNVASNVTLSAECSSPRLLLSVPYVGPFTLAAGKGLGTAGSCPNPLRDGRGEIRPLISRGEEASTRCCTRRRMF